MKTDNQITPCGRRRIVRERHFAAVKAHSRRNYAWKLRNPISRREEQKRRQRLIANDAAKVARSRRPKAGLFLKASTAVRRLFGGKKG